MYAMTELSTNAYQVPGAVASRQLKMNPAVVCELMCHMQPNVTVAVPVSMPLVTRETL